MSGLQRIERPPSTQHEAEHQLLIRLDVTGRFVTSCTCGEELSYTRQAPHHCLGLWRRHSAAQTRDRHDRAEESDQQGKPEDDSE